LYRVLKITTHITVTIVEITVTVVEINHRIHINRFHSTHIVPPTLKSKIHNPGNSPHMSPHIKIHSPHRSPHTQSTHIEIQNTITSPHHCSRKQLVQVVNSHCLQLRCLQLNPQFPKVTIRKLVKK
jgi:hypothetical protein